MKVKFGLRKPSLRGRISSRLSPARVVRHRLGLKAPRGWGWFTNPRKALYNRIYRRTTVSVDDLFRVGRRRRRVSRRRPGAGCGVAIGMLLLLALVTSATLTATGW